MTFNILIDTGFWIALFDKRDYLSNEADRIAKEIETFNCIIPFPTLYEFINSNLSRRDTRDQFERFIKQSNVFRISDKKYKKDAFKNVFLNMKHGKQDVSLVDEVIKLMLQDKNLKIDYFVSFDSALIKSASSMGIRGL